MKEKVKRTIEKVQDVALKRKGEVVATGLMVGMAASNAMAWTAPTSGSFGYDVYDIAINQIAKGPIGFVLGAGLLAGGVLMATRSAWVPSLTMIVGSGLIFKLDTIAQSLGYTI